MLEFFLVLSLGFFGGVVRHYVRDWETFNRHNFIESVAVGGLAGIGVIYLAFGAVDMPLQLSLTLSGFSGYLGTNLLDEIVDKYKKKYLGE